MKKTKNIEFTIIPAIIASVFLLLSFLNWSYGYYTFLRIIVSIVAIYYMYFLYTITKWQSFWFWALGIIVILFNPIIPIYLGDKTAWGMIDIIAVIYFISFSLKFKEK